MTTRCSIGSLVVAAVEGIPPVCWASCSGDHDPIDRLRPGAVAMVVGFGSFMDDWNQSEFTMAYLVHNGHTCWIGAGDIEAVG